MGLKKQEREEWVRIWCRPRNVKKEYGFFQSEQYDQNIFVHKDVLKDQQRAALNEFAIFDAKIIEDSKGLRAVDVVYIENRIPDDTQQCLNNNLPENFALEFFKYARFNGKQKKFDIPQNIQKTASIIFSKIPFENLVKRYEAAIKSLHLSIKFLPPIYPAWRFIIGLGTDSVYETGITLHHVYGFPYIPGQSIKGSFRSWIINEFFDKQEDRALQDQLFCDIFGCPAKSFYSQARQGLITFFDALPLSAPDIELDVMNPHYSEYYQGNKPPADYLNPVPIFFLTVGKKTSFQFVLGIKKTYAVKKLSDYVDSSIIRRLDEEKNEISIQISILDFCALLLQKSLKEFGLGAKTSVGYGYFNK